VDSLSGAKLNYQLIPEKLLPLNISTLNIQILFLIIPFVYVLVCCLFLYVITVVQHINIKQWIELNYFVVVLDAASLVVFADEFDFGVVVAFVADADFVFLVDVAFIVVLVVVHYGAFVVSDAVFL